MEEREKNYTTCDHIFFHEFHTENLLYILLITDLFDMKSSIKQIILEDKILDLHQNTTAAHELKSSLKLCFYDIHLHCIKIYINNNLIAMHISQI